MAKSKKIMTKPSIKRLRADLESLYANNRMVVFLCGPTIKTRKKGPGARLRKKLEKALAKDRFEVVLGEDDGLEALRKRYTGYAHENELKFIKNECGAIVLVADSVGSYCELGLFSHVHTHTDSNKTDFIVIVDKKYKRKKSYLNEGPAKAIKDFGTVFYVDLEKFDCAEILERLRGRRTVYFLDGRGRPPDKGSH